MSTDEKDELKKFKVDERLDGLARRWNELHESGDYTDCSFLVGSDELGQKIFECHRLVLASCSSVFGAMLLGPMAEKSFPIIVPDVAPAAFAQLLKFAYTGQISPSKMCETIYVCKAADKYMVTGLVESCVDFLCEELSPESLCPMFLLAEQHNLCKLKDFCIRMLQMRTSEIIACPNFVDYPTELVALITCQNQLNTRESRLVEAVLKWALTCKTEQEDSSLKEDMPQSSSQQADSKTNEPLTEPNSEKKLYSLRKRAPKESESTPLKKRRRKINSKEDMADVDVKLREILEPTGILRNIRFLAPSLSFHEVIKKYPGLLSKNEIMEIEISRERYELADKKGSIYGPWPYGNDNYYENNNLWPCTKAMFKVLASQKKNPLPNNLCNKFDERECCATVLKYEKESGGDAAFTYAPTMFIDLRKTKYLSSYSGNISFTPNRPIVLHGIQIPSQVSPVKKHPLPDLSYNESIEVSINGKDAVFEKNVPYNSIMNIMFPKPVELDMTCHKLYISFNVGGNYPSLDTTNIAKSGSTTIETKACFPQVYNFIQGLIFDTRDRKTRGPPCEKPIEYSSGNISSEVEDDYDFDDSDDGDDSDDSDMGLGFQLDRPLGFLGLMQVMGQLR